MVINNHYTTLIRRLPLRESLLLSFTRSAFYHTFAVCLDGSVEI